MDAEAVLEVAVSAYWQRDPADVSVNAICQMAGVSKPSLYREFGSEDGLTRAALDRYAGRVLSDVFAILQGGKDLRATLDALVDFACADPRMETGCLFYKMRAGKHRLGPETRARVEEIDAAAHAAYAAFLQSRRGCRRLARRPVGGGGGDLSRRTDRAGHHPACLGRGPGPYPRDAGACAIGALATVTASALGGVTSPRQHR